MANLLYFFSGLMILVIVGLAIYLIRLKLDERKDAEDRPLFENFMPQYSDGHTDGTVSKITFGDKRVKIDFVPKDINYISMKNNKGKIRVKPYSLFFDKNLVDSYSQGGFSGHRQKLKGFPPEVSLLPKGVLQSPSGKTISSMINNNLEKNDEKHLMELRQENLMSIAEDSKGLNLLRKHIELKDSLEKDVRTGFQESQTKTSTEK